MKRNHRDKDRAALSNSFEKAFSDFLDRREYDQAENALFSMVRIAFLAGWRAAGGNAPPPQKVVQLVHKEVATLHSLASDIPDTP